MIDLLIGRKITKISRMTKASAKASGLDPEYMHIPLEITLEGSEEHGSIKLFALSDDEGNDGGVMICKLGKQEALLEYAVE